MDRTRYDPELKIAASEYRSEIGYLVREFEAEAERKKVEMKNRSEGAKEERAASKRPFLTRLFDRRRTSR